MVDAVLSCSISNLNPRNSKDLISLGKTAKQLKPTDSVQDREKKKRPWKSCDHPRAFRLPAKKDIKKRTKQSKLRPLDPYNAQ
jgi:hypothetical protein